MSIPKGSLNGPNIGYINYLEITIKVLVRHIKLRNISYKFSNLMETTSYRT